LDNFLRRDWVLRVIALVVAVVVWAEVGGAANPIVTHTYAGVPIAVSGESPGQVARLRPSVGTVVVAGAASVVNSLTPAALSLSVDVSGLRAGTRRLPLRARLPSGAAVVSLNPQAVEVTLIPGAAFRRQVEVASSGVPAVGNYVAGLEYAPSVTVSGPRTALRRVVAVRAVVSVAGASATFVQEVRLTPVDAQGRAVAAVTAEPAAIPVTVQIKSYPSRAVAVSATVTGVPAPGFTVTGVSVHPSEVVVYGPTAALAGITSVAVRPLSVTGFSTGFTRTMPLVLPPGVVSPVEEVAVSVQISPAR
jgi:YbbR domain-containing protein